MTATSATLLKRSLSLYIICIRSILGFPSKASLPVYNQFNAEELATQCFWAIKERVKNHTMKVKKQ